MRRLLFSILHSLGVPHLLRRRRVQNKEICVLMFHRVSDDVDPLWPPLPVATFRRLMEELVHTACVVSVGQIGEAEDYPEKPVVVLSFDDGYLDFLHNAMPVLAEYGLPAHHNVCPGLIGTGLVPWTQMVGHFMSRNSGVEVELPNGGSYRIPFDPQERDLLSLAGNLMLVDDRVREEWVGSLMAGMSMDNLPQLMDWDDIRRCAAAGVEIGSHGMEHRNLARVADCEILEAEIDASKKKIENETGVEASIFSFPNGMFNSQAMEQVRLAGYKIALVCENQTTVHPCEPWKGRLLILPRVNISRPNWAEGNLRFLGFHQLVKSK